MAPDRCNDSSWALGASLLSAATTDGKARRLKPAATRIITTLDRGPRGRAGLSPSARAREAIRHPRRRDRRTRHPRGRRRVAPRRVRPAGHAVERPRGSSPTTPSSTLRASLSQSQPGLRRRGTSSFGGFLVEPVHGAGARAALGWRSSPRVRGGGRSTSATAGRRSDFAAPRSKRCSARAAAAHRPVPSR